MNARFLIVGGAEKAGTTSLHGYLSAHPQVCASMRKETDFFRAVEGSLDDYLALFPAPKSGQDLYLESSPGYLAEAPAVAGRIAAVVPAARIVFVLRDPIERLRSCFSFYQSRLHLPAAMTPDGFAELCLLYAEDPPAARRSGVADWHLNALARGRYEIAVAAFAACMPRRQLLVLDYRDLGRDLRGSVRRIARFAGIDDGFYDDYEFGRENVSFVARNRAVQRAAIVVNDGLEGLWRRHPALKRRLLSWYKSLNAARPHQRNFGPAQLARLRAHYEPTYRYMDDLFSRSETDDVGRA